VELVQVQSGVLPAVHKYAPLSGSAEADESGDRDKDEDEDVVDEEGVITGIHPRARIGTCSSSSASLCPSGSSSIDWLQHSQSDDDREIEERGKGKEEDEEEGGERKGTGAVSCCATSFVSGTNTNTLLRHAQQTDEMVAAKSLLNCMELQQGLSTSANTDKLYKGSSYLPLTSKSTDSNSIAAQLGLCQHVQDMQQFLYAMFVPAFPIHEVFPQPSLAALFSDWGVFLELGLPAGFSLFLEWGSYELMAMISGQLGTVELATHGVFMSTCAIIYMVPLAVSDATSVLAGNYLGNRDPVGAKSVIALGMWYDMSIGLVAASILQFLLRPYWGRIFTSDPAVQREIYDKLPIMFVYITVDSMKCIALNVLRSTGRPQITMVGNIICCVAIMLPLGWYLGITLRMGLFGVWGATSVGWLVATVIYLSVLYFTDWDAQAQEAQARIGLSKTGVKTLRV
jgi:hypothetical protein